MINEEWNLNVQEKAFVLKLWLFLYVHTYEL